MVAAIVCFLDSCFDLSVKSSIFCKYVTEVLDLSHLLELSVVDVEFAVCSVHLHCLGLADADLHVIFFTGSVQANGQSEKGLSMKTIPLVCPNQIVELKHHL